ncbi:MAG TPA: hypothetical protein VM223_02175, partial [Planctomycetota bacterium]|nr:hypothetical protein [Planctomycetota bacterium]
MAEINTRFSTARPSAGLFLFEGLKGSGKSHLLLLVYHLLSSQRQAQAWLTRHGLQCSLPNDAVVVLNKFTDLPIFTLWDFIFEKVGIHRRQSFTQPGLAEMESALAGRKLILILDELEQGIRSISNDAVRAQNIAFLQMLSEWGNRSNQVTVFASIYSTQQEPGDTLKRVPRCEVQFKQAEDRAKVILHRLFDGFLSFRPETAEPTIDSYLNVWRRHSTFNADDYRATMLTTFPFLPDLMDLLLLRLPARGGFQQTRSALGLLGNLIRLTHGSADIITPGHASVLDNEMATRLSDLDPGMRLVGCAANNLRDLKKSPFAPELAATVMLYTLAGAGDTVGATREEIVRSVLRPGSDINEFEGTLLAFKKYASHFWIEGNRHFFDLRENPDAAVELASLKYDDPVASAVLHEIWLTDVFKESKAVVFTDAAASKHALEALDKNELRWCIAPRRLRPEERHELYFGLSLRNQVILLEPRDEQFSLDKHPDLLKWAKRLRASNDLVRNTADNARREAYEHIGREDKKHIVDVIRRAGLVFTHFEHFGATPGDMHVEFEPLGVATREEIRIKLGTEYFNEYLFADHMRDRLT